jgi:polyisoprenoid-binding protein YceI
MQAAQAWLFHHIRLRDQPAETIREENMRKLTLMLIVIALTLAACGGQSTPTSAPVVNDPPAATQPPAEEPLAAPTEADPPAQTADTPVPQASSGATIYKIVPGESQLQYEVGEVFITENNRFNTAVGVTRQVAGEITLDPAAPQGAVIGPITADISQFESDSGRRDGAIRGRFLESEKYPTVTFVATQIDGLPTIYQEGQPANLTISGDLTIRDVTKPVQFTAVVLLAGGALSGEAITTILMSDFGFGPISIAGMLKTEDQAKVSLSFVARP